MLINSNINLFSDLLLVAFLMLLLSNESRADINCENCAWTIVHTKNNKKTSIFKTNPLANYKNIKYVKFNKNVFKGLKVGSIIKIQVENNYIIPSSIIKIIKGHGSTTFITKTNGDSRYSFSVITIGADNFYATIIHENDRYVISGVGDDGIIVNESAIKFRFSIDKINDFDSGNFYFDKNIYPTIDNEHKNEISNIGLMVIITKSSDILYNNDPESRINHLIAVTNQIFIESNVNIRIELRKIERLEYSDNNDPDTILNDLVNKTAPAFANLNLMRYTTGSDLVMFMRPINNNDKCCGLAKTNGLYNTLIFSRDTMFSFVGIDCLDIAMAHEIGHNLGLKHSERESGEGGVFSFSRGYGVDNFFVTVMANGKEFKNAKQIFVFSNPDLDCLGSPCGIDSSNTIDGADATQSLNLIKNQVASYYEDFPSLDQVKNFLINNYNVALNECLLQSNEIDENTFIGMVETVKCSQVNINNLDGIENLKNIKSIDITAAKLKDINAISSLKKLEKINLGFNDINNIESISTLENLRKINLLFNNIHDISALSGLKYLETLNLDHNSVEDISPISYFSRLKFLDLRNNPLSSLQPLASMQQLTYLRISEDNISNISVLSNLVNLSYLNIENNNINNLIPLKNLKNLAFLFLGNNDLTDISPLFLIAKTKLKELYLSENNNIYCWQQDYIQKYISLDKFEKSNQCSVLDDASDFDNDGISNDTELKQGDDPTTFNAIINKKNESGGVFDYFTIFLLLFYCFYRIKYSFAKQ